MIRDDDCQSERALIATDRVECKHRASEAREVQRRVNVRRTVVMGALRATDALHEPPLTPSLDLRYDKPLKPSSSHTKSF